MVLLPPSLHDALAARAAGEGLSLSSYVRSLLIRHLRAVEATRAVAK